ncbi:rhombosortase [Parasalinivibrio latis]|uniref:rhombosortase n=1 Tax=Parasalinivibrio latis TaxID=2952610 RepID=UPI003DA5BFC0
MCLAQLPTFSPWLDWQRQAIEHGQWWRILTGNLTHTNFIHLVMNGAALTVITFIFRAHYRESTFLIQISLLSVAVGLAMFFSDYRQYAGLSGVLHGLFVIGAVADIRGGDRVGWLLLAGVFAKILWEQVFGASADTAELIGASVATEAHLAGGIVGLAIAALSGMAANAALGKEGPGYWDKEK